jgi:hypothetical protein
MSDSREIVNNTSGIIFLGTPHQGSPVSIAGAILALATRFLGSDPTLLLSLRSHNASLSNLADEFLTCIAANEVRRQKVRIISFYETMPMYLLGWFSIGLVRVIQIQLGSYLTFIRLFRRTQLWCTRTNLTLLTPTIPGLTNVLGRKINST